MKCLIKKYTIKMQENDTVLQIRASNRENLSELRQRDREALLRQRRLFLNEVEALVSNISLEQFKDLVLKVKQKKATLETLMAIKNNCCTPTRSQSFFRLDGALDSLIRIVIGKDAPMQLEAIACLTNLACGSHKASYRIAKTAGPYLVSFISSGSCYLQDQCSWASGNIANDCSECFSLLKSQGVVPALLMALKSSSSDTIQSAVFALNACTQYGDQELRELICSDTMGSLLQIIDQDIFSSAHSDAAFVLCNICYLAAVINQEITNLILQSIVASLSKVVSTTEISIPVALPLIRCLGFLSKDESACFYLSQNYCFTSLMRQVLVKECHSLRKETLWLLSNIYVNTDIGEGIIDLNLLHNNLDVNSCPADLSLQAFYCLCTLATKNKKVCSQLQQEEFIAKVKSLINCGDEVIENVSKTYLSVVQ